MYNKVDYKLKHVITPGVILVSGLFDLRPLVKLPINGKLNLDLLV